MHRLVGDVETAERGLSVLAYAWMIVGGIVAYLVVTRIIRSRGLSLERKFQRIGRPAGKTRTEIIAVVGKPSRASRLPGGQSLLQWIATGYHISLRFRGEVCDGIVLETNA
jgi:hypothetical protein